jgi:hypothetical protein
MYDFKQNIDDLIWYFEKSSKSYASWKLPLDLLDLDSDTLKALSIAKTEEQRRLNGYLLKSIIFSMCIIWETYSNSLRDSKDPRYPTHFPNGKWSKYANIHELFVLRNCLVHRNGKIDTSYYLRKSKNPYGYSDGDYITLTEQQISNLFSEMRAAYSLIVA